MRVVLEIMIAKQSSAARAGSATSSIGTMRVCWIRRLTSASSARFAVSGASYTIWSFCSSVRPSPFHGAGPSLLRLWSLRLPWLSLSWLLSGGGEIEGAGLNS